MKNILTILFVAFAISFSLSSCRDNAGIPDHGPVTHPQEDVQGTYKGEWTRSEVGSDVILSDAGSLVFSPSEYNYVTSITASSESLDLDVSSTVVDLTITSLANITPGAEGYIFNNTETVNGFGAAFSGSIKKSDNTVWLSFKKSVKSGIKTRTYTYTFNGTKQ